MIPADGVNDVTIDESAGVGQATEEDQGSINDSEVGLPLNGSDQGAVDDTNTGSDDAAADEPAVEGQLEFKYGDLDVTVEVPEDLRDSLKEKGIDANGIVKELYGSKDFTLSQETKDKLSGIYGKFVVDSFLDSLKMKNDSMVAEHGSQLKAAQEADEKVWSETLEAVGGEENWAKLEEFALSDFSDEDLSEFNRVMNSGSRYAQKLAIRDLQSRMTEKLGVDSLQLENGSAVSNFGKGFLTQDEYLNLFKTGEYRKDSKRYDALRAAGMAKGY